MLLVHWSVDFIEYGHAISELRCSTLFVSLANTFRASPTSIKLIAIQKSRAWAASFLKLREWVTEHLDLHIPLEEHITWKG